MSKSLDDYGANGGADYTATVQVEVFVVCGNEEITPSEPLLFTIPLGLPVPSLEQIYLSDRVESAFSNSFNYDPATILGDPVSPNPDRCATTGTVCQNLD